MQVYDNPKYYEIAFSFRNISKEVDFVEQLIKQCSKIPVETFLEIASGNSPHMQELRKRGYGYIGLELNDEMVVYARDKIKQLNLSAQIIQGDMIEFSLPRTVDCVLLFLGSFYIKSDEEFRSHLNSVAKVLKDGGLYILDGVVSFYPEDIRVQSWEMREENIKITTTYKPEWVDEKEKIMKASITLDVEENGFSKRIEHEEIRKMYSADEFISKAEQTGQWEHAGSFGDFNMAHKPRKGGRNTLVLKKK